MRRRRSILCGLIIVIVLTACTATGPPATDVPTATPVPSATDAPTATPVQIVFEETPPCMLACVDTLTINLDGVVPQDYELNLILPAGERAGVRCVYGRSEEGWVYGMPFTDYWDYIYCSGDSVLYTGTPSSFTVTVTWDDNQIVQHYEPTYEDYYVCGTRCYAGGIKVTIPTSP